jgi:hypothetical protein
MSRSRRKNSGLLCLCLLTTLQWLSACTIIDKEIGESFIAEAKQLLVDAEEIHADDVLTALGPPQALSGVTGGYVFLYQHFAIRERQLGFSSDEPFLRWFKLSLADAGATADTLVLRFDSENRLVASGLVTTRDDLGDAGSVMFALNFQPMIDTAELDRDLWGPDRWGFSLLQAPTEAQNRHNSPDSGLEGIELRGSPTGSGQRTLEFR